METGLDYFLARYYSSTQGRFTSPDEFTGGPDELYYFVDIAAENPTFYADITNPQSLNKYQYTYNNPLRYTDADGHCPVCPLIYWELSPAPSPGKAIVAGTVAVGAAIGAWWVGTHTNNDNKTTYPRGGEPIPQPAPTPVDPRTQSKAQPQAPPAPIEARGNRDQRKVNTDRSDSADRKIEGLREKLSEIRGRQNKTKADKKEEKDTEKAIKRELDRKKKSEPHGIKGKGN